MDRDANKYGYNTDNYFVDKLTYESDNDYVGKETTIDFGRDLRMSQPWRSYSSDEIFTIVKKIKSGLYLLRDSKGNEHPLSKSRINYFKK